MPTQLETIPAFTLAADSEVSPTNGTAPHRWRVLYDYPIGHKRIIVGYTTGTFPVLPANSCWAFLEYAHRVDRVHVGAYRVITVTALDDDAGIPNTKRYEILLAALIPGNVYAGTSVCFKRTRIT